MIPPRIAGALALAALLVGCTVTGPVIVRGADGHMLRGTFTATTETGIFSVTDGALTCSGTYDPWDMAPTITMPVRCSDGRAGQIIATRDPAEVSGSGVVRLDDGTEAQFLFGKAAEGF